MLTRVAREHPRSAPNEFDSDLARSYHPLMPMWRCPHCATPQAETARCWVCHRSSTACGACRHFRRSVAAQLGYCGMGRERGPLSGDEVRPCWEAADATGIAIQALPGVGPVWPLDDADDRTVVRPALEFVEVESVRPDRTPADDMTADFPLIPGSPIEPRWSLWGEPEA